MCLIPFHISMVAVFSLSDSNFAHQFNLRLKEHENYIDSVWTGDAEPSSHVFIAQDSAKSLGDGNLNSIVGRLRTLSDVDSFVIDQDSMIFFKKSRRKNQGSQSMKLPTELIAMKALDSVTKIIPGGFYRSRNAIAGPDSWFKIYGKKEIFIEHARFPSGKHFKNHARLLAIIYFLNDYAWSKTSKQLQKEIENLEIQ